MSKIPSARTTGDRAMSRATSTALRLTALDSVSRGSICFHNGFRDSEVGYSWVPGVVSPMTDELGQALHDLWVADLIDIDTRDLFAPRGHRVVITRKGTRALRYWSLSDHGGFAA